MVRRSSRVLALAGAAALAACSDNTITQQAPEAPVGTQLTPHLGVAPVRGLPAAPRFANNGNELNHGDARPQGPRGAASTTGISYHGGTVLTSQTKVAAVYWASTTIYPGGPTPGTTGTGAGDGSNVGYFLRHIGGSPYFNINHTYYNASGTLVANIVNYTQFWANNSYSVPSGTTSVSDNSMLSMLQYAFNNGKLTYDSGTLYTIFTSGSVNLGGGFGRGKGGHEHL